MPSRTAKAVTPAAETSGSYSSLNGIKVPISELRDELFRLKKAGIDEYPLGDLLYLIRGIVRKKKEEDD